MRQFDFQIFRDGDERDLSLYTSQNAPEIVLSVGDHDIHLREKEARSLVFALGMATDELKSRGK